jgi:hypothetical protein
MLNTNDLLGLPTVLLLAKAEVLGFTLRGIEDMDERSFTTEL